MVLNEAVPVDVLDWEIVTRVGVAAVVGLLLGLDRELRGHAAGLRTHGIVCVAAAIMTISIFALHNQLGGLRTDPLRIFEATGSFIGIIGAGLIVFSRGQIHNITTAAHLWLAAGIGIACGAAQWPLVATGTVVGLVMVSLLLFIESKENIRRLDKPPDGIDSEADEAKQAVRARER